MADKWDAQIRINLAEQFAQAARKDISDPILKPLADVLKKHNAVIKNQFDAFSDYCKEAEARGDTDTDLYRWTKDTIERPGKEEQYATRFTIYADGGKETYSNAVADVLEADLKPLEASGMITKVSRISTDPAKNPQAPKKFRR